MESTGHMTYVPVSLAVEAPQWLGTSLPSTSAVTQTHCSDATGNLEGPRTQASLGLSPCKVGNGWMQLAAKSRYNFFTDESKKNMFQVGLFRYIRHKDSG